MPEATQRSRTPRTSQGRSGGASARFPSMKVGVDAANRNHEAGGIDGFRAADWLSRDCGDAAAGDTDIGACVVHLLAVDHPRPLRTTRS